jgi:transposase
MLNIGSLMTSILLKEKSIDLRWNIIAQKNTGTKIIGADIGLNTAVSLSDNQQTISCNHGHNLKTICKKISTKKRGSKNYKKAVAHRINYINWSVKQLNLNGIKLINVESNKNIKHSRRLSSYLNSWSWRDINSALINQCELLGVQVKHNKSYYRSQRCFSCGYVHKSNRSQETFECCHCGHTDNADLNAAKNNSITLFSISYDFMALKLNRTGFFWGINSLFDLNGEELAVSHTKKKK